MLTRRLPVIVVFERLPRVVRLIRQGSFGIVPYFGESKIDHGTLPGRGIKKKVGGLQIAVDDSASVDIAQCSEHAAKVLSDPFYG